MWTNLNGGQAEFRKQFDSLIGPATFRLHPLPTDQLFAPTGERFEKTEPMDGGG
jgi:hypothetical protein